MSFRPHDVGSLNPSDDADVELADPTEGLAECDYYTFDKQQEVIIQKTVETRDVTFINEDTLVVRITTDYKNGYALGIGTYLNGVNVGGVKIFIGVNSKWRKTDSVTCIRARMSDDCSWVAIAGSYDEALHAKPTAAETVIVDTPALDPYYSTLE